MAKSRWGWPRHVPSWPFPITPIAGAAGSLAGTGTLDAVGEKVIFAGSVIWADGGTHDLRSVRWRSGGSALTNGTLQVSARDVDLTAGPPTRDDGVVDQSTTHANPAASTNFTSTFSADRANVATGALLAIVFEITVYVAGSTSVLGLGTQGSHLAGRPAVTSFLASTYAAVNAVPTLTLVAADGTLGMIAGGVIQNDGALTALSLTNATSPDEWAVAFTPSEPCWVGEMFAVLNVASGADFDLVLYEGTTALVTVSFDANAIEAAGVNEFTCSFPDVELSPNTTYYVSVKPTTANAVTVYVMSVPTADGTALMPGMAGASRVDGGAWAGPTNIYQTLKIGFGLVAGDDGAGTGGFQPTLRAGMI